MTNEKQPIIFTDAEKARAYDQLRRQANELGHVTIGEALDKLEDKS